MPRINPIMKPPPIIRLGTEKANIVAPQILLLSGLSRRRVEPSSTSSPKANPKVASEYIRLGSLPDDPGSVGIMLGNHVVTMIKPAAFVNIKSAATKENRISRLIFSLNSLFF